MARDVSVAFRASDNLTNSIRQMQRSVNGLSRDVSEYRRIQSQAFDKKAEVKLDISNAKKELKELEKAVRNNVEGSRDAFRDKQKALEELQEEYRRLTQVAREAGRAERQLQEDVSRSSNANATRVSASGRNNSILTSLAGAGLGNMLGGALSNGFGQTVSSMFGSTAGNAIGGIVGGVTTGAAMGSIAGPVGAAVGAAVGGLTGAINALVEVQQKNDDYFKDEVKTLYEVAKQSQEQSLQNGIGLESKFEQNMISFSTLLKGKENADKFLEDVIQFSAKTPFEESNLLNTSKTLLSYGYKQDEIIPLMTKVGDAGSALGMKPEDINFVATSLGRMNSSGKTTLEYLNPLIERGIPAIRYLSESLGKTEGQIYDLVSKGLIPGAKAAEMIAKYMGKEFEGNMEKQSITYEGLLSTLDDTKNQLDKAMGEGYNKKRKEGMQVEIATLGGDTGDQMKKAYALIGEYQADLENQYQKSLIEAITDAQNNDAYKKAMQEGNGAEMGRILAEARAKAEIDYKNSEGYKLQIEADLQLVKDIQVDVSLNDEYVKFGIKMAEQFSKGYAGAMTEAASRGLYTPVTSEYKHSSYMTGESSKPQTTNNIPSYAAGSYATGIDRVPYDDMPAYLHEGERVLTRLEADKQDRGMGGINIAKFADQIIVREEADINKIARAFVAQLVVANEIYAGG